MKNYQLFRLYTFLFLLTSLLSVVSSSAQSTYQKQLVFNSAGGYNISSVVYSGQFGNDVVVVTSSDIIVFDPNAGTVVSQNSITSGGAYFTIDAVYRKNNELFCIASKSAATEVLSYLFKYDLATSSTIWQKRLHTSQGKIAMKSITGDGSEHLYIAGALYNDVLEKNNIIIIKTNADGSVSWSEQIGQDTLDEVANSIVYKNDSEIYFSAFAFSPNNPFGKSITFRCNNLGSVIASRATATVGHGPRLGENLLGVLNNQLYTIDATFIGPSDPGPVLFRKFDASLTELSSVCRRGVSPRSIFFNDSHILLTGQAPMSSGLLGFRTVRFDADLNITGSRYFYNIPTYSIASSASCFITDSNASYHFIKSGSFDTIQVIRSDSAEYVGCVDTSFNLGSATFAYTYLPYEVVIDSISVTASPDLVTVAKATNITIKNYCPSPAAVTDIEVTKTLQIFPNPAGSEININYPGLPAQTLSIQNLLGLTVLTTTHTRNVDISLLAPGLYFIKAMVGTELYTAKLIKR